MKHTDIHSRLQKLKLQEVSELKEALKAHGGVFSFDDDCLIISLSGTNTISHCCDVCVKSAALLDKGLTIKAEDLEFGGEFDVCIDDIVVGQISEIIEQLPEIAEIQTGDGYFIDIQSNTKIHANLDSSIFHGAPKNSGLIPAFLDVIVDTPEYVQLVQNMPSFISDPTTDKDDEIWVSEQANMILVELFEVLGNYTPGGYYFGTCAGDGHDFGYWKKPK